MLVVLLRVSQLGIAVFAVIALCNIAIDPLGIISPSFRVTGFNAAKPMRPHLDRQIKPIDIWRFQPRTVFLGSSRIKQAIDPQHAAGLPTPVYNGGIDGAGYALAPMIDFIIEHDRRIERIYIEVFATAWMFYDAPSIPATPDAGEMMRTARQAILSLSALRYSLNTIAANWKAREARPLNGFFPLDKLGNGFSVSNIPNFVLGSGVISDSIGRSTVHLQQLKPVIARCEAHGIDCRFVLTPLHADALYGIHFVGAWPELLQLKRDLANLAPTYDFLRYSPLMDERAPAPVYWPEAFHFSPALGDKILGVLSGAAEYGSFGTVIRPRNIDAEIAAFQREFDQWVSKHPDIRLRYEAAARTYLNPPKEGRLGKDALHLDGDSFPVVDATCGRIKVFNPRGAKTMVIGSATDGSGRRANGVAVLSDNRLVAFAAPNIPPPDDGPPLSGFFLHHQLPPGELTFMALSDHACTIEQ